MSRGTTRSRFSLPRRRSQCRLALGVLRSLAGLLQAVLLGLGDARVTGQEAGLLECRPVVRVDLGERASTREPQRAGLTGDATAAKVGDDVERLGLLGNHERLANKLLVHLVREVRLEGATVER